MEGADSTGCEKRVRDQGNGTGAGRRGPRQTPVLRLRFCAIAGSIVAFGVRLSTTSDPRATASGSVAILPQPLKSGASTLVWIPSPLKIALSGHITSST